MYIVYLCTASKELERPRPPQIELNELRKGLSPCPIGLLLIISELDGLAITRKHNTKLRRDCRRDWRVIGNASGFYLVGRCGGVGRVRGLEGAKLFDRSDAKRALAALPRNAPPNPSARSRHRPFESEWCHVIHVGFIRWWNTDGKWIWLNWWLMICLSVVLSICAKLKSFPPSRDLRLRDKWLFRITTDFSCPLLNSLHMGVSLLRVTNLRKYLVCSALTETSARPWLREASIFLDDIPVQEPGLSQDGRACRQIWGLSDSPSDSLSRYPLETHDQGLLVR